MGIGGKSARLYGLPEPGQTDISTLLRVRRERLIPDAHPRPFCRPSVDLPGLEPDPTMDSFEINKILGALLGTCILVLVTSFAAHAIFAPVMPEKPGFEVAVQEEHPGGPAEKAPAEEPLPVRRNVPITTTRSP